jgi:peptidyl-dipeptidase A
VDRRLAERLGIAADALMPWHYQNPFFQEPPEVFNTGLEEIYKAQDTLALCRKFYGGIDLDIEGIIGRSDLYEKEGKSPHAFEVDIDRKGDIRMIANIVPGLQWQQTMIHELGHGVYDEYIDPSLPWLLREAAHPLTTEGLAMMIDRVVGNPRWAEGLGILDEAGRQKVDAEARAYLTFAPLQFSRWTQVMLRFERELYRDPAQDLNAKWWDLVEQYQGLKRPPGREAPDYASKVHLTVAPVYYHNYMMGDLFGAQVHEAIAASIGSNPRDEVYVGKPAVGAFLKAKVFGPGSRYSWNELTELATGAKLSAAAFARRFQD